MNMFPGKAIAYGIPLLSGLLLIASGIHDINHTELLEARLVEQYLANWYAAPFFARVFPGLKFLTGIFLIAGINPRNISIYLFGVILVVHTYDLIWQAVATEPVVEWSYAGWKEGLRLTGISIYLVLFALFIMLYTRKKSTDLSFRWGKLVTAAASLAAPFIVSPLFPEDFTDESLAIKGYQDWRTVDRESAEQLPGGKVLVAFMSPSCPHCLIALRRIAVSRKRYEHMVPVRICFAGKGNEEESREKVAAFFSQVNTTFNYTVLDERTFFTLAGRSLPFFVLMDDKKAIEWYDGRIFSYGILAKLSG